MSTYQNLLELVKKYLNHMEDPELRGSDPEPKVSDIEPKGYSEDMEKYSILLDTLKGSDCPTENFEFIEVLLYAAPWTWEGDIFLDTHPVLERFPYYKKKNIVFQKSKFEWFCSFISSCREQEEMSVVRSIVQKYVAMEKVFLANEEVREIWDFHEPQILRNAPDMYREICLGILHLINRAPCTWKSNEEKLDWKTWGRFGLGLGKEPDSKYPATKKEWKEEWKNACDLILYKHKQ